MGIPVTRFRKDLIILRREGYTLQEIGDRYHVSRERIRQIVGTVGKPKTIFSKALKLKPTFLELRKNHTIKDIAKKFHIPSYYVGEIIKDDVKRLGIKYIKYPPGFLRCYSCHVVKSEKEFSLKARLAHSGRRCRKCAKMWAEKYMNKNMKLYGKGGKYYESQKARQAVSYALEKGRIKKGDCILKNKDCFGRMEAHHYLGYEKEHRLDIVWTCSQHHDILDKMSEKEIIALL